MTNKEEEYLTFVDIEDEMADFLTIQLSSGKKVIMRKISKDDESKIRRKHTKQKYDSGRTAFQELDTDRYNDEILVEALVKPKLTLTQVRAMPTVLYQEIFSKYALDIGLVALTANLESTLRVT